MLKKVLIIFLAISMVIVCFAGCNSTTTTTTVTSDYIVDNTDKNDSNANTDKNDSNANNDNKNESANNQSGISSKDENTTNVKNPLGIDLGGSTITIYSIATDYFNPKAKATTKSDQARISALKKLEEKLNCKIKNVVVDAGQLQTSMFTTISSGKSFAHIVQTHAHASAALISSKLVEDINKIATIDVNQDYLNVGGAVEASTFGGGTWYVAEPIEIYKRAQGIYFNKRILKEIGLSDAELYKMVSNKKWTIAKMRELAQKAIKDLDGKPGMSAEDRWGITFIDTQSAFAPNVLEACGARMLITESNGNIKYNMESKTVMDAITLAGEITRDKGAYALDGTDTDRLKLFSSGKSLFLTADCDHVIMVADMEDDFGFLPFPLSKEGGEYTSSVNWNSTVLMIPKGLDSKELKKAGSFLQAYAYLAEKVNDSVNEDWTARYFRDDESGENFAIAAKGQHLNVTQTIANTNDSILSGTYRVLWEYIDKGEAISTKIQSKKSATVTAIKDLLEKLK